MTDGSLKWVGVARDGAQRQARVIGAIALCVVSSCAGPPPADRIATVEAFRAAMADSEFDRAREFLGSDARVWYGERSGAGEPWLLEGGTWQAWDDHFDGHSQPVTEWTVDRDAVYADMLEINDYYRLTESPGTRWRATYFFEETRIVGFMVSATPDFTPDRGRRDEFEGWARAHAPEEAEYLMPGGSLDPTGDRAPRMRALLNRWRTEVGLSPIPAGAPR